MTSLSDRFQNRYQDALEEELRESLGGQEDLLHNMLLYQLGWKDEQGMPLSGSSGERLHPLLCLVSCEAILGEYRPALPAAATVELVHNYSLIHGDVQSGSPNRGQRPTVWWIWGPGQAINAGDGMHALARLALMRLQQRDLSAARVLRAMRLLDRSCLAMCEGQHLDLVFQEKLDVGVDAYFKMAAGKTGALMSCAMGLGGLIATEDVTVEEAFGECGKNLGIAHQIVCDIGDLWGASGEETAADNVLNKKKLLPIVYTMAVGEVRTKRELGSIYFKRVLEPEDARRVVNILNESSALEYAERMVDHYCQAAIQSLEGLDLPSSAREDLQEMCRHVIGRGMGEEWKNGRLRI